MLDRFSEIRFCNSNHLNLSQAAIIVSLNKKMPHAEAGTFFKFMVKKYMTIQR